MSYRQLKDLDVRKCFICGGKMKHFLYGFDFLYKTSAKKFEIYRCLNCKVEQIIPPPTQKEIKSFYPDAYYSYNTVRVNKSLNTIIREKIVELSYIDKKKKDFVYFLVVLGKFFLSGLPLTYQGDRTFLDVGCGDGYNVELLRKYGWDAYGFEIGLKQEKNNIFYDDDLLKVDFRGIKFDYIRVWHVLEHVANPAQFLNKMYNLLKDNGELSIGIPNTASFYAKFFGKYWYNRDIPRHLINYSAANLILLLEKNRFRVVKLKYQSAGGFLGSIQHSLSDKLKKKMNYMNSLPLFVLSYPADMLCNLLKTGDCIAVTIKKKKN